jgi:hypothetical protein
VSRRGLCEWSSGFRKFEAAGSISTVKIRRLIQDFKDSVASCVSVGVILCCLEGPKAKS